MALLRSIVFLVVSIILLFIVDFFLMSSSWILASLGYAMHEAGSNVTFTLPLDINLLKLVLIMLVIGALVMVIIDIINAIRGAPE